MKKLIVICLTALAWNVIIKAQDCFSLLKITAADTSMIIFVDGKAAGKGSASVEVKPGTHYLSDRQNSREWDINGQQDSVVITDCGITKEIKLNGKKEVFLNTIPQNAEVYYKDSLIGKTPVYLSTDMAMVELKKQDYKQMKVIPADLNDRSLVQMEFLGGRNHESFMKSNLFKILIGSAAVLGGTAAYYKLKANDFFDDYNQSGSQASLDKTNKYDTLSGVAFGALQINFGVILYFLLTD